MKHVVIHVLYRVYLQIPYNITLNFILHNACNLYMLSLFTVYKYTTISYPWKYITSYIIFFIYLTFLFFLQLYIKEIAYISCITLYPTLMILLLCFYLQAKAHPEPIFFVPNAKVECIESIHILYNREKGC